MYISIYMNIFIHIYIYPPAHAYIHQYGYVCVRKPVCLSSIAEAPPTPPTPRKPLAHGDATKASSLPFLHPDLKIAFRGQQCAGVTCGRREYSLEGGTGKGGGGEGERSAGSCPSSKAQSLPKPGIRTRARLFGHAFGRIKGGGRLRRRRRLRLRRGVFG